VNPRRFGRYDYNTYITVAVAQMNDIFTTIFKCTDCCNWTTGFNSHTCYADTYLDHWWWVQDVFDDMITSLTFILLVLKKTTLSNWYSNLLTAAAEPQVVLVIHAMLIFFFDHRRWIQDVSDDTIYLVLSRKFQKKLIYCFSWTEVVWAVINARP